MQQRNQAAGGIFIFLGLLIGVGYGLTIGQPILWMLYGFGAGIAIALLTWLVDRWRD